MARESVDLKIISQLSRSCIVQYRNTLEFLTLARYGSAIIVLSSGEWEHACLYTTHAVGDLTFLRNKSNFSKSRLQSLFHHFSITSNNNKEYFSKKNYATSIIDQWTFSSAIGANYARHVYLNLYFNPLERGEAKIKKKRLALEAAVIAAIRHDRWRAVAR